MTAFPGPPILDALDDAEPALPPRLHKLDRTHSDPTEQQRALWRQASSRRRQRENAGERVFHLPLPEKLVVGALMAAFPAQADRLTDHVLCEVLLARLVAKHLPTVIDDLLDVELRVDIQRMLRDFDK